MGESQQGKAVVGGRICSTTSWAGKTPARRNKQSRSGKDDQSPAARAAGLQGHSCVARRVCGLYAPKRGGALNDHSALSREPVGSCRGQRLLAGPPDDHQVFTDPRHPPVVSGRRLELSFGGIIGKRQGLLRSRSTGSNCRSCRPVPCAPLSSGDQGCQDGQKTARGRHFLRPPFCRIEGMVNPAFRAVKSQVASSYCTSAGGFWLS
jgi:hypothetical protein